MKSECTEGPHLHFSVRENSGMEKDINNLVIGGYQIKTGLKSYDEGCEPEIVMVFIFTFKGRSCCFEIVTV